MVWTINVLVEFAMMVWEEFLALSVLNHSFSYFVFSLV